MEKKVIEVPITGITTNTEEYQDGACQQLHNLRNKHGEWRVVGNKINTSTVELGATGSTDIPDAAVVIDTLLHPALGSDYLLVHFTHEGDHYLYSIKLIDDTWERQQSLLTGASEVLTIDSFGEYLLVSTVDKGYTFKINTETKVFTELPLFPEPEEWDLKNIDYKIGDSYIPSSTSDLETMMGPFFEQLGVAKTENRYRGSVFARLVFTDQQGNHVYVSPMRYSFMGNMMYEVSPSFNVWTQKDILLYTSTGTKYIKDFSFSGLRIVLNYTESQLDAIREWYNQGVLKSVCVFLSRPYQHKAYTSESWQLKSAGNYYAPVLDSANTALKQLEDNSILYKAWEMDIEDYLDLMDGDGIDDGTGRINVRDIENITSNEVLQINNTWTAIRALRSVLDYNAHAHLCGVRNEFRGLFSPLVSRNHLQNLVNGYTGNILNTFAEGLYYRDITDSYDEATFEIFINYRLNVKGATINLLKQIAFEVFSADTVEEVETEPDRYEYQITESEKRIFIQTGFGFPTEFTKSFQILLKQDGVYYKLFDTENQTDGSTLGLVKKTKSVVSDEAVFYRDYDMSDISLTNNIEHRYIVFPEPDADLSASGLTVFTISQTNNYYDDVNRVQVSYQDNPFVFPSKYSYRFGTILNSVVAAQTAADAMSEGQFGQFPLYVFTGSGIYSLDHGTGDILYQTITPLNREVALSKRMIIPAASTVVFATARGLLAMQGREVIELSRAMDGSSELVPASDLYMSNVLSDTTHLSEAHTFTGFDFNADIARSSARMLFDDKEDEILISVKEGSNYRMYAYNINTKMWSTRSDKFDFVYQAYPGYRAARISTIVQGEATVPVILLYNPHSELGKAYYSDVVIITRPVFTDFRMYKNIKRVAVKGKLTAANNAFITLLNHYSSDEDNYRLIAARQAEGSGIRTLYLHDSHVLTKCNIYTLIGRMKVGDVVSHILIEYAKRFKTKLR